ncbi:hypothetical protein C0992_013185, partial [Termitomyces sp. T32_za158]
RDTEVGASPAAFMQAGSGDEDEDSDDIEDAEGKENSAKSNPDDAYPQPQPPLLVLPISKLHSGWTGSPLVESEDEEQPKTKHPLTSRQAALASVGRPQ